MSGHATICKAWITSDDQFYSMWHLYVRGKFNKVLNIFIKYDWGLWQSGATHSATATPTPPVVRNYIQSV